MDRPANGGQGPLGSTLNRSLLSPRSKDLWLRGGSVLCFIVRVILKGSRVDGKIFLVKIVFYHYFCPGPSLTK